MLKQAKRHRVLLRLYSNSWRGPLPGAAGTVGLDLDNAWIPLFSSMLSTAAPAGGDTYRFTIERIFAWYCGSVL